MSKAEVLAKLKETGKLDHFQRDPAGHWQIAFNLYNAANKERLSPSCGHCFRKVKAWLIA